MPYAKSYDAVKIMDAVTFNDEVTTAYSDEIDAEKFKKLTLYLAPTAAGGAGERSLTVTPQYEPEADNWFDYDSVDDGYTPIVLDSITQKCVDIDCVGKNVRIKVEATGTTADLTLTLTAWAQPWS